MVFIFCWISLNPLDVLVQMEGKPCPLKEMPQFITLLTLEQSRRCGPAQQWSYNSWIWFLQLVQSSSFELVDILKSWKVSVRIHSSHVSCARAMSASVVWVSAVSNCHSFSWAKNTAHILSCAAHSHSLGPSVREIFWSGLWELRLHFLHACKGSNVKRPVL